MKNKEIKNWMLEFGPWNRFFNEKKVMDFFLAADPGKTLDTCNMDFSITGVIEESSDKPITLHPVMKLMMKYGRRIAIITEDGEERFFIRRIKCSPEMDEIIKDAI